jgi:hypothetical protein
MKRFDFYCIASISAGVLGIYERILWAGDPGRGLVMAKNLL